MPRDQSQADVYPTLMSRAADGDRAAARELIAGGWHPDYDEDGILRLARRAAALAMQRMAEARRRNRRP